MHLEPLKELTASTLALRTWEATGDTEVVLVRGTPAGDFLLGGCAKGNGNVWLREVNPVRLRGLSALVTFGVYADTCTAYSEVVGPLRIQSMDRCDGRAVTRTQHARLDELVREVYTAVQPDLATLWAAIEWRQAEARVLAVATEMEARAAAKADIFAVLNTSPKEVPALLASLKEGRIDGTLYAGECCCLVGTLAQARGIDWCDLPFRSDVGLTEGLAIGMTSPAEQWFLPIRAGQTPEDDERVALTVEWVEEWTAQHAA